jgi:large subunit ribosomal protein L9
MKVLLKENVKSLGNIGEVVNVSPGFARNFLVPRKLAIIAGSAGAKGELAHQKIMAKKIEAAKKAAQEVAKKLNGLNIVFIRKVGANSKLFGSITTLEISDELIKLGHQIDRKQISLDRPIKQLGQYEAKVKVFTEVEAKFNVKVEIDPVQAEELKKQQKEAAERKKKEAKAAQEAEKKAKKEAAENAGKSEEVTEE